MGKQAEIMRRSGFISAVVAAEVCGYAWVGTIHNQIKSGGIVGTRAGRAWYVSVASLLKKYRDTKPIYDRILALGVPVIAGFPAGVAIAAKPKPAKKRASA